MHLQEKKPLTIDGDLLIELPSEERLIRFLEQGSEIEEVKHTREELIKIFKWANDLLRKEGLRNLDRFVEFSNILFIKIISELEDDREKSGNRELAKELSWDSFCDMKSANTMLNYINNTVLKNGLAKEYNHSDDIFQEKLKIKTPQTVKYIVDKLSGLTLLNTESEVKGDAFEYFLKSLASGNDLAEYFTPRHIVKLMVRLINPKFGNTVFDPFCGTGGFLIEAFRHIKKGIDENDPELMGQLKNFSIFGIELTDTYKIAKMNMIITGDGHNNIISEDTAKNNYWKHKDLKKVFAEREIQGFDVILSNIPYGLDTDYGNMYPILSKKGDSIFVQHIIQSLNKDGKCDVLVPEGLLFKKEHKKLRKYLLERCDLETVISLPSGVFLPYTMVKTDILIFTKGKATKKVWFYDMKNDGFELTTRRRKIGKSDIFDIIEKFPNKETSEQSFTVPINEIIKNNYKLIHTIYKKVDFEPTTNQSPKIIINQLEKIENEITNDIDMLKRFIINE